jgi:hypothetical protein
VCTWLLIARSTYIAGMWQVGFTLTRREVVRACKSSNRPVLQWLPEKVMQSVGAEVGIARPSFVSI